MKTFIDLFCGTGGFSISLTAHGCKCVFSNDMEKSSKDMYQLNFPDHKYVLSDIQQLSVDDIPRHDILCAGFPCQPFSIAGKKLGFQDKRSNVFYKLLEILENHSPSVVILENVKNLVTHDKGNTFKHITNELERIGYSLKHAVLDTAKHTTIPHHRERIYIVGFKNSSLCDTFDFDFPTVDTHSIDNFLEDDIDEKYYYTDRFKVYERIAPHVNKKGVFYQYRRHYVRENKSGCCPTLTANMGSGGHNVPLILDDKGIRKLTPRECFNFQGFPSEYKLPPVSDSKLYKLAGNAISIPIVNLIIEKLLKLS